MAPGVQSVLLSSEFALVHACAERVAMISILGPRRANNTFLAPLNATKEDACTPDFSVWAAVERLAQSVVVVHWTHGVPNRHNMIV